MSTVGLPEPGEIAAQQSARVTPLDALRAAVRIWAASDTAVVASLAIAACLVHWVVNFFAAGRYGFFRDELYYAACGAHLSWGYVDHAPLVAAIARFTRGLLGDSLLALRFFPALSAGAKVLIAAWMARELGGRRFAQSLAALTVLVAPIYLTFDNLFSMNAFEPVFWMLCAALGMRIMSRGHGRLWPLFGLVAGLGLLNKHSMLFFGSGVVAGLLLTPERRVFREKWIWLGGLISFAIFLPNLIWEYRHGWPTLEILRIVGETKTVPVPPLQFILEQALLTHPLAAPIWLAGLFYLLFAQEAKPFRFLGWAYVVVLGELLVLKGSKIYYLAPIYPMLLAAGAVWIERFIHTRNRQWLKPAIVVPLVIGAVVAAPLAMPILPVEATARYSRFWNVEDIRVENHEIGKLPQLFADMFGWENQVGAVAQVFRSLPAADQAKCALFASNFGEAGAIDYFGAAYGLPQAISNHNSYYLWGPRNYTGEVVITVGFGFDELRPLFGDIRLAATLNHPYALPDENNVQVYICRQPKIQLRQAWPKLKLYN